MYEDIMRRPMFQNAQQRASSGIMTGVAPVQGFDRGGEAYAFEETYNPEFQNPSDLMDELSEMREGEGIFGRARKGYEDFNEEYDRFVPNIDFENFASMEQTEGTGINTRDIVDTLIVDYEDPIDVALSGAAAALIMVPPAAAVTSLVRMGYKVNKARDKVKQLFKVKNDLNKLSDSQKDLNKLGDITQDRGLASILKDKSPGVGEVYAKTEGARIAAMPAQLMAEAEEEMANGGIATLPVQKFKIGGVVLNQFLKLFDQVPPKDGIKIIDDALRNKTIKPEDADELYQVIIDKVDDVPTTAADDMVQIGEEYILPPKTKTPEMTAETLDVPGAKPPSRKATDEDLGIGSKPPEAPDPISSGTKIDDVVDSAEAASDSKIGRALTYPIRNPVKTTLGGAGVLGATDLATGSDYLSEAIEGTGNVASGVFDDLSKTAEQPEVSVLLDTITPDPTDADDAPDRELMGPPLPPDYLPLGEDEREFRREMLRQQEIQPKPDVSPSVGREQVEEERSKVMPNFRPFGGKIAKALLGEDEAFGSTDPANQGFLERTISKLQDPRTRYALAKAAQPSEGAVPRNFLSDVEIAGQEYDDMIAQREYLSAQTRDVDKTDTEKLVDYYVDSVARANPDLTERQLLSLRTGMNKSLFKSSRDAAELAAKLEILSLIPNASLTSEMYEKLIEGSVDQNLLDMIAGNVTQ